MAPEGRRRALLRHHLRVHAAATRGASQYYFGGNGDGTLFYPGTPAKIGGTSHIPIASLRMKMIREGMEDYEYFKALADAGDATMADTEAAGLSPKAYQNMTDPAQIDAARHRIALRIEALTGQTPPPMDGGSGSAGGSGSGSSSGGADTGGTARRRQHRRRRCRPRRRRAATAAARWRGAGAITPLVAGAPGRSRGLFGARRRRRAAVARVRR